MKKSVFVALGAAGATLLGASAVMAQAEQSDAQAGQCRVVIDRSQDAGVFDVTRQSDDDGNCICYAYTGPETQGDPVEAQVASLEQSKRCPDAKVMAITGPAAGTEAGGSGFLAGPLAPLLAVGALGGGAAAAAGAGGNAAPVSP